MDLMGLQNSFDHLTNRAEKCLSKDLYSAILDATNTNKKSEDNKMLNIDCEEDQLKPSLAKTETITDIVKNLFTTSKMCDQIFDNKEGPPSSTNFDANSELDDLTVRGGVNSESFK